MGSVKRSMSLSDKMNDDLVALTDALGVNPHSYMINELAKSIQRDSLALKIKDDTQAQMNKMMQVVASAAKDRMS